MGCCVVFKHVSGMGCTVVLLNSGWMGCTMDGLQYLSIESHCWQAVRKLQTEASHLISVPAMQQCTIQIDRKQCTQTVQSMHSDKHQLVRGELTCCHRHMQSLLCRQTVCQEPPTTWQVMQPCALAAYFTKAVLPITHSHHGHLVQCGHGRFIDFDIHKQQQHRQTCRPTASPS